ncbi:MAG: Menaquinone reductase, multiheme cytochrome c subunit [Acidobacteria bacterium]|nr:Menaquinone reductase, multiheme cytochrome c subunit [Acidobacteriota bacterium]
MPQIFHRRANTISRVSIYGAIIVLAFIVWALYEIQRSPYNTRAFVARSQPVQFSHKHHAGDDGIDCRYCHTTVETSSFAGIPPTSTCMNCHSQLFSGSPFLEPVRESFKTGKPLEWTRVHDLPEFVYFNHSIHVNKGIGCSSCHGRVDEMPLMWNVASLHMEWCLGCHRDPAKHIRPRDQIVNMDWPPPGYDQMAEGKKLMKQYNVKPVEAITNCTTCHR